MTKRIDLWIVCLCRQGTTYLAIPHTTREKAQAHYERLKEEFTKDDIVIHASWVTV